jgi:hypothetical protein
MQPSAPSWHRHLLILAVMSIVLIYPSKPSTVVRVKSAVTSNIANAQSRQPVQQNARAVGLVLAIAALLQSGHQ